MTDDPYEQAEQAVMSEATNCKPGQEPDSRATSSARWEVDKTDDVGYGEAALVVCASATATSGSCARSGPS